ncbi:MarR family transcriptional regulator [Microcoleus sp. herbarium2]|uniref:MarR family transcriptional regulator n=1 Tax=Microcoleus sp. herbarium2 TaxID=3055433 RepID=UPI002FD6FFE7
MVTTSTVDRTNLAKWHDVLAPHSLGYRLKLLAQLGSRRLQEVLEPYGLTAFHWLVLCCLSQEDGLPTSSIGDKLQQVGGTLTGVLDRMEERGLVRRQRDSRDRRIWRIWLTDSGRELQEVLPPLVAAIRDRSVEGFSQADRELFSQLIDRAIVNLS